MRSPKRARPAKRRGVRGSRTVDPALDHVRKNLRLWERQSASYDRRFEEVLSGRFAMAWGFWRIPESELRLLGPVRGRRVLELGCGAARWTAALARRGADAVGLDLSTRQLAWARAECRGTPGRAQLVRANAERVPFADGTFDIVFSDWGAMTFCDPYRTVPEAARVLRPGGRLVFATSSPLRAIAQDRRRDRLGARLRYDYFGLHTIEFANEVNFALGYSEWIRLFDASGLHVASLREPQAPPSRRSRYLSLADERWARRWPIESIWVATKG